MKTNRESILGMLALSGVFLSSDPPPSLPGKSSNHQKDLEAFKRSAKERILSRPGVREWEIDGFTVIARDEKNARRKAENAKRLLSTDV